MKKLFILIFLLTYCVGFSQIRVLKSELIHVDSHESPVLYYKKNKLSKKRPFNGIAYNTTEEKAYVNGILNGLAKEFNNGIVILQGNYIDAKENGIWKKWDNTGDLIFEGNYVDGEAFGLWKFYTKGILSSEGNLKTINQEAAEDGPWKYYDTKERVWQEINYVNGEENGLRREWYPNGQLRYRGVHKESKQDDICRWFYANGVLKLEQIYDMGLKAGKWQGFFESGELKWEK